MAWALRKKTLYASYIIVPLLIVVGWFIFSSLQTEETCFDGKQNQDEIGIDCGGACSLVCEEDIKELSVLWSRPFPVVLGVYNVVSYIENPNKGITAGSVEYSFKLYDSENLLITERQGEAPIPDEPLFAIFESGLQTGNRVPVRASFELLSRPVWSFVEYENPNLRISNITLTREEEAPRITATLTNPSLNDVKDIVLVATVFDSEENAINTSRTVVGLLSKDSSETIVFTWPHSFSKETARIDLLPVYFRVGED